ncbi:hypothetical protein J5X84_02835 [Streptosporangiaceae bacterium NEAU-GS5]|nr:hypothetical protein [Streptosporangiaceae bacterium NEAU-GS5]
MQKSFLSRVGYAVVGSALIVAGVGAGAAQAGTATATQTTSTTAQAKGTFGPRGFDGIKLGMSLKKVKATGKITHEAVTENGKCSLWEWKKHPDRGVFTSKKLGVIGIVVAAKERTPQGVGLGTTKAKLKKIYPKIKFDKLSGQGILKVGGKPKAKYVFDIEDGRIYQMNLGVVKDDCN